VTNSHYFSSKPSSKEEWGIIETILRGRKISIITSTGVFSAKHLDNGTRLLIEKMAIPTKGDFLDLGCGVGIIGIMAAIEKPELLVHLSDVNPRAVKLTTLNVKRLGLKNCCIYEGSIYEPFGEMKFDIIVSNPPISAGMRNIVFPMVSGAYDRLFDGGTLQMVVQSNKGGRMLAKFFDEVFGEHKVSAIKSGYRVLTALK
jgi:16S rRNA (guanine1207-N2)-methyltransferase